MTAQQFFEALVGTLRAAKKRKIISFKGQVLLKGAHDNVAITLLEGNDDEDAQEQVQDQQEQKENAVDAPAADNNNGNDAANED